SANLRKSYHWRGLKSAPDVALRRGVSLRQNPLPRLSLRAQCPREQFSEPLLVEQGCELRVGQDADDFQAQACDEHFLERLLERVEISHLFFVKCSRIQGGCVARVSSERGLNVSIGFLPPTKRAKRASQQSLASPGNGLHVKRRLLC